MSKKVTIIKAFVASPDDARAEREIVKSVAEELNYGIASSCSFRLEVVDWLNSSWPDIGKYPQDVINRQIGEYDVFVGILWKKFGKPTRRAASGTVEEFDIAVKLWRKNPETKIMMYFNREPFYPTKEDSESFPKILDFKSQLSEKGVRYEDYEGQDDFRKKIRQHLTFLLTKKANKSEHSSLLKKVKSILASQETMADIALHASELLLDKDSVVLAYLDVDAFKKFNDSVGFEAGNQALEQVVATLVECIGRGNKIFRVYGDEFALLAVGSEHALTVSFGYCVLDGINLTAETAIQEARRAVHVSKLRGGNRSTRCPLSRVDVRLLEERSERGHS